MPRRVRKHANPFNCRTSLGTLDVPALFGRVAPLEVELGSGYGEFLIERAANHPERDFVGLEVREPMVEQANERAKARALDNLLILYANANTNLRGVFEPGSVERFHVHFPDPWPKKRHWKRRILRPATVRAMAELLPIGGELYAQSDVEALAREMFDFISGDGAFTTKLGSSLEVERPLLEATHWEKHHERRGEPVYRMLFEKTRAPSGPVPEAQHRPTGPLGDSGA